MMCQAAMCFLKHCQEEENDQVTKLKQAMPAEVNNVRSILSAVIRLQYLCIKYAG